MKRKRILNKGGFTLVELIVTIALMAIVASVVVSSYTNVLESQRMKADMSTLNHIDDSLKQILLYDDAFEDIKDHVYDDNKMKLTFYLSQDKTDSYINLSDTIINIGTSKEGKLDSACEVLYQYLVEYIGSDIIDLESSSYKFGTYEVYIEFNGAKVSDVRDYTITNDTLSVTNSDDEQMSQEPII
jgi:prepilin-type N-terminal cleavage/methylation domain-containing protein